jgi:hypothetical protein
MVVSGGPEASDEFTLVELTRIPVVAERRWRRIYVVTA